MFNNFNLTKDIEIHPLDDLKKLKPLLKNANLKLIIENLLESLVKERAISI